MKRKRSQNTSQEKIEDILGDYIGVRQAIQDVMWSPSGSSGQTALKLIFNSEEQASKVYEEICGLESKDKTARCSALSRTIYEKLEYEDVEINGSTVTLSDMEIVGGSGYVAKPEKAQNNAVRRQKEEAIDLFSKELKKIWPEYDDKNLDLEIEENGYVFMIYKAGDLKDYPEKVKNAGKKVFKQVFGKNVDLSTVDYGELGVGQTAYVQVVHALLKETFMKRMNENIKLNEYLTNDEIAKELWDYWVEKAKKYDPNPTTPLGNHGEPTLMTDNYLNPFDTTDYRGDFDPKKSPLASNKILVVVKEWCPSGAGVPAKECRNFMKDLPSMEDFNSVIKKCYFDQKADLFCIELKNKFLPPSKTANKPSNKEPNGLSDGEKKALMKNAEGFVKALKQAGFPAVYHQNWDDPDPTNQCAIEVKETLSKSDMNDIKRLYDSYGGQFSYETLNAGDSYWMYFKSSAIEESVADDMLSDAATPEATERYNNLEQFIGSLGYSVPTASNYASQVKKHSHPGFANWATIAEISYKFNVKDPADEAALIVDYINGDLQTNEVEAPITEDLVADVNVKREIINNRVEEEATYKDFVERLEDDFDCIENNVIQEGEAFDIGYDPRVLNEAIKTMVKAKYKVIRG